MTSRDDLHERSVTDDAFYEWLLSDHPDARAERDYRRAATHQHLRDNAAAVRAWVDKVNAQPDAPQDLAASMGPRADQAAARAEADYAEPDEAYVGQRRAELETHVRVSGPPGSWDYRYPAHLTGPDAASYPPPPEPETDGMVWAPPEGMVWAVRSQMTWPFLRDVAKQVARSHESWPIRRSAWPVPQRPTWWSRPWPRNWPHGLRRTVDGLSQDNWPTGRSAA